MKPTLPTLAALAAVSFTAGCSGGVAVPGDSEYSCAGRPEGVVCRSTRDIYALTETRDHVHEADLAEPVGPGAGGAKVPVAADGRAAAGSGGAPREGVAPLAGPVAVGDPRAFAIAVAHAPRRADAQVVRIWIAPWQDQNGDLRMPGHVYAEVRPRSWSFGAEPPAAPTSNLLMTPEMIQARDGADSLPVGAPLPPGATRPQPPIPPGDAARRPAFDPPRTIEVRS